MPKRTLPAKPRTEIATKTRTRGDSANSVQTRAEPKAAANMGYADAWLNFNLFQRSTRTTDVLQWGASLKSRQSELRKLWRLHGGEVVQAAIAVIIQKVQSTTWVIEGPKALAEQAWAVLHNADFGQGWEEFLARVIIDYLTQDNGMFWEVIGAGDPAGPLEGPVLGIAQIDSARCTRTGDIDFPVTYTDMQGNIHKLHFTRVLFAADMPAPEEDRFGVGFCALSRSVATAQAIINWSEMRNEMIDDMPPQGLLTISGMNKSAWDKQYAEYQADRDKKNQQIHRGLLTMFNSGQKLEANLLNFRQTWEGFTESDMYDNCFNLVAMAFGLDRQDIAPLTGHALGSGAQADVLSQKSRGKGVGNVLSLFERFINRLLPEALVFRFDFQDDAQDKQQAEIQAIEARTILSLYASTPVQSGATVDNVNMGNAGITTQNEGIINREEARYLLAKKGILPRELLAEDERMNPGWEAFDDITVKARRRFGEVIRIEKSGDRYRPRTVEHVRRYQDNIIRLNFEELLSA